MKLSTSLALAILIGLVDKAAGYEEPKRTWTQKESGLKLEATILDKMEDGSKAKVETDKGAIHWLVSENLIKSDQVFISD
ncbi:hypothetical protein [Haloferula sp.]|uniref:hypothetical protein n=1 Tax=Haloferula sp. TaxID=2497595 RepID=UPI00329F514E